MPESSARLRAQREYWNGRYGEDPALFGEEESLFARWSWSIIRREASGKRLIELGAGYGRDLRFFQKNGLRVKGVDCADKGAFLAQSAGRGTGTPRVHLDCAGVFEFLEGQGTGSAEVIYSNLFYNMDFTVQEHRRLFREAARVLVGGGLHLYSVRSVRDPWYGKGRRVRKDTFDLSPDGTVMHFFSETYVSGLRANGFRGLRLKDVREGGKHFPIRLLYVADRSNPHSSRSRSTAPKV